ncbi:BMP family protein [Leucobacter sp. CSA2]|uniref:BMP family protein n=1 Tax=Leucobacter edaphi TaxID=2796472 RepID=A0A934UY18_9MICO|nr:BMP family protein [Leucobacter edaphi]MBK0422735.1 BMP family protein [Leucobacter edaphi]
MAQNHRRSAYRALAPFALISAAALGLVGCGGQAPDSAGAGSAKDSLKVGIFVDNAFGDGDFFDQSLLAKESLVSELDAQVKTYEGQLQAQNFGPMLQDAADANDIVFVLGFEAIDAMNETAKSNPNTRFVFIDGDAGSKDVTSAVFHTQEGCYMAGALAATVNQQNSAKTAGFVGGVNAPVVKNCESGFTQGVAKIDPAQNVSSQYVGSFVDPAKGSEIASSLASTRGAYSVFAYAGLSGSGVFDAAKSGAKIAPIGVVADKSSLAPGKVPGSLVMGVDHVIEDMAKSYKDGKLKAGELKQYGFADGGWAMVYDKDLVDEANIAKLEALQKQIVDGSVKVND